LNRAFVSLYLRDGKAGDEDENIIPKSDSRTFDHAGFTGKAEIKFKLPSMNFDVNLPNVKNSIEMRFPMRLKAQIISPIQEAFTIDTMLAVTATLENKIDLYSDENQTQEVASYIVISFANIPEEGYIIEIQQQQYKKYELLVKYVAMEALKKRCAFIPLSPVIKSQSEGGGPGFNALNLQVYNDPLPTDIDFLSLLISLENLNPPANPVIAPLILNDEDYAVAISREIFDEQVQKSIEDKFGGPLPRQMPNDPSILLRELSVSLQSGYVAVSGKATKELGCSNANVDFSGKIAPSGYGLKAYDIDVDLPWVDFIEGLAFLLDPISGGILTGVIDSVVGTSVGSAFSGVGADLFLKVALFSTDIPVNAATSAKKAPRVLPRNKRLTFRPDAMIIGGTLILLRKTQDLMFSNFICNTNTMELHTEECEWAAKIGYPHRMTIMEAAGGSLLYALELGYNGCYYCLLFYDTDQFEKQLFD
jgi:hypothetical protein